MALDPISQLWLAAKTASTRGATIGLMLVELEVRSWIHYEVG